jgi:hypothetical protein
LSESSHDLVAANSARVRDILRIVGAGRDIADTSKERHESGAPDALDDGSIVGTWSAWNS